MFEGAHFFLDTLYIGFVAIVLIQQTGVFLNSRTTI